MLYTNGNNQIILNYLEETIAFNEKDFKKHLLHCDINIQAKDGTTPLMYIILNNQYKNIFLSKEEIYELCCKANFNIKNEFYVTIMTLLLFNNENQKIGLLPKDLKFLWEKMNKENQELTFQQCIHSMNGYEENFEKIFDLFFNNFCFIPNEKIIKKMKREHISIFYFFEKKNLFLKLNKELKNEQNVIREKI